ncbi:MAG: arsenosugar biosynthesis radical SAM protein ArsS [Ignavibacteria bacterium]|nr:arsenosugar biosynthesis radical SAM protein ArsS [Ignavibacteria bacterium]
MYQPDKILTSTLDLPVLQSASDLPYNFQQVVNKHHLNLSPLSIDTLQVNITKMCNQACLHCHVDASPKRTESMDLRTVNACLEILQNHPEIINLDITGGAPELNPHFDYLVIEAKKLGKHVMIRHNLTVTLEGHPTTSESKEYLPAFFAEHHVEVISSLPYYQEFFTDKQRGKGVFHKSIESALRLNSVGFGMPNSGLLFNLVYNPVGSFLPAPQANLEQDFKLELRTKYGIEFNHLFTMTNMPIHRFKDNLQRRGAFQDYMDKLLHAFNPTAAGGIMCRSLISVGYDGSLYDCDFNQMLDMNIHAGEKMTVFNFDAQKLLQRNILFASHCFGCTAGAGSSCGGTIS